MSCFFFGGERAGFCLSKPISFFFFCLVSTCCVCVCVLRASACLQHCCTLLQPVGGVKEGQILRIPRGEITTLCCTTRMNNTSCSTGSSSSSGSSTDGKTTITTTTSNLGHWKGGIFSWYQLGLCHPVVCNAIVCPQVLLSQILTRMNMTWLVAPTTATNNIITTDAVNSAIGPTSSSNNKASNSFRKTFRTIMGCLIVLALYDAFMAPPLFMVNLNEESGELIITSTAPLDGSGSGSGGSYSKVLWHQFLYILLSLPMSIYGILVVMKLRAAVRAKYGIPTGMLGSAEDFCYVFWCNCCVLTQLARQTADYDIEQPSCCSSNGLLKVPSSNKKYDKGSTTSIPSSFPSLSPLSSSKMKLSSQDLQQLQQSPSSNASLSSSSSSTLLV